jgi:hypothetical protein
VGLYSGCTALVVGNSVKAGVRFVSYDHFKQMLANSEVSFFFIVHCLLNSDDCALRAKSVRPEVF